MIASLTGLIQAVTSGSVVLNVSGVGYLVHVPILTLETLMLGTEVTLLTEMLVREDAITLVGFRTEMERQLYIRLTSVQGVGRQVAMNLLSLDLSVLVAAINTGDTKTLSSVAGVGPRLAARLSADLSGKLVELPAPTLASSEDREIYAFLDSLGVPGAEAAAAVRKARDAGVDGRDAIIRRVLRGRLAGSAVVG